MKKIRIDSTNGRPLVFNGKLLSVVAVKGKFFEENWKLYITESGKYICQVKNNSFFDPETIEAKVCESLEDVFDFFGFSPEAKKLYSLAGIDCTEYVE